MSPHQASRAADIFTGLVVASVAIALAGFTWHLFGLRSGTATSAPAAPAAPPADVNPVVALAPFGRPDASSAQPTSLALQLKGVVVAIPSSASSALIAPAGGQPVAYTVGQSVGGATIEAIALSGVLLRNNGRLERLDLPRLSGTAQAAAAPPPPAPGASPPNAVPATGPSDGSGPQALQSFAPAAPPPGAGGPLSLLDRLGAAPVDGAYRVGSQPSPEATRAGLLPGDVIDRINGMPATAVAADRQLIASIIASGPAQVEVMRAGKRISFSFALR